MNAVRGKGAMHVINWRRLAMGGVIAGIVVNLGEYFVSGVLLRDEWERAMLALNRPMLSSVKQVAALQMWGLLMGFAGVILYVHLRDRYGAGAGTACLAGLAVWIVGYLSGTITGAAMSVIPASLAVDSTIAGLVEILLATALGSYFYQPFRK